VLENTYFISVLSYFFVSTKSKKALETAAWSVATDYSHFVHSTAKNS